MRLRDYQAAAVEQVAAAGGTGLLALALGAGKTYTALTSAGRSLKYDAKEPKDARVLIVAPLHTIDGWRRHVEEVWGLELRECAAKGADRKANLEALWDRNEKGVFFIGWSLMTARNKHKKKNARTGKMVSAPDTHAFGGTLFDVVIADEVHRACNPQSLNSKVLCRIRARRRLALSATPAGNLPVNIFGALKFLWPMRYTSFTRFADFFFKSQFNPYSESGYGKLYGEEKWPGRVRATTPCTYNISEGATATEVVAEMVSRTVSRLKSAGVAEADYETVLIKASIVEREATPTYYGQVARVIDNRLADTDGDTQGKLGMDSTILYGLGRSGGMPTQAELDDASNPYNTRIHPGLPPTPIGSPGKGTITAVLNPPAGDWLYFVTINLDTGETRFASTYAEQQANEQLLQQYCAANEAKCSSGTHKS